MVLSDGGGGKEKSGKLKAESRKLKGSRDGFCGDNRLTDSLTDSLTHA
jgi:hypothetical protein